MFAATALLVSTDPSLVASVQGVTESIADLRLEVLPGVEEACSRLGQGAVVLTLVHQPQGTDLSQVRLLVKAATAAQNPVATLVLSDRYHASQALALLRLGVVEYLARPLDLGRLSRLVDMVTLRARYLARHLAPAPAPGEKVGETHPFLYLRSGPMGQLMEQVLRVAPQETTLLLTGETGTGKTRLARLIHERSGRSQGPFLTVNCAALTANLIESELFGHARGAFTGADRDRVGKLAEAARGTLLLDEIDSLPPALQAKLLRVAEERVFEPVGSNRTQCFEARLIAASNRDLEEEVAAGRFRSDLYYRLNVVSFYLPPLRERPEVIPPMVDRFVAEFAARNGRDLWGVSGEALGALQGYDWPGNVRELRNVIERAVALCPGPAIQLDDLPEALRSAPTAAGVSGPAAPLPPAEGRLADTKEKAEAARILQALQRHNNNRLRTAVELGISRMTLYKKMHRYGLMRPGEDSRVARDAAPSPGQSGATGLAWA
jgi:two-component system response regulator PilR (NtrC family)